MQSDLDYSDDKIRRVLNQYDKSYLVEICLSYLKELWRLKSEQKRVA